jgi:hypothetical protein
MNKRNQLIFSLTMSETQQRILQHPAQTITATQPQQSEQTPRGSILLQGTSETTLHRVTFDDTAVDNEHLNKRKSKSINY